MRLGVLDIGSNTAHLLVVDAHHGAAPVPALSHKSELRLAEHLTPAGDLDHWVGQALIDFMRSAQDIAEEVGVTQLMAFATSAIREAPNGEAVLDHVQHRTGVAIDLLSGEAEARLTFLAARRWFGWSSGRLLLADIGGGSLELAVGADEEPDEAISLLLGAGRLTRNLLRGDPPGPDEVREARREVRAQVASVVGRVKRFGVPEMSVATSKTFKQLARITGAAPSAEGLFVRRVLSADALAESIPRLAEMTAAQRAELPGVSVGRAPQLLAGAIVAAAVMDLFEIPEFVICPWALREGVILNRLDTLHD